MLRRCISAVSLVVCLSILGCSKSDSSTSATTQPSGSSEILVGEVASLTGDTATFGVSSDEGLQLALEAINAKGGVLGKKIRVIREDDGSLGDQAKTAANKLITKDNVCALIGEIASSRSIAMASAVEDLQVPMLSPGSTNPKVTQGKKYVFRNCFIDTFQGEAMARFAVEQLKLKKFAILYPSNSDYGMGLKKYVEDYLNAGNGTIVASEAYTEKSDTDFRGQLTKIKQANPDAIFATGYYTEAGLIAKQARELGINCPLIGGDGWDSDQTVKIGGSAVEGCFFTNHYAPDEDRPEVKKFVADYKAKYAGKTPDAMAILGYDAMNLMADAITRAGSADPQKITDAIAATKDFPAACGPTTIDADHNAKKPIVVIEIKKGEFTFRSKIDPK